ncbi:MAG: aspartate aminotransferase family protein [Vulcanimicrobiaceae bacterium]
MDALLDPTDWPSFRAESHRILDAMLDYLQDVRDQPTWQPPPEHVKEAFAGRTLPTQGTSLEAVFEAFSKTILPYPTGNIHPRFFGWVHGSGTPVGALSDFLAAVMNSNVGGREHAAVYVERQVIAWFCDLFNLGTRASGLLLGGTSMANFAGILVARTACLGHTARSEGLDQHHAQLVGYASSATHNCLRKAFEMAGLGSDALRVIATDSAHCIDLKELNDAIARDRAAGLVPFLIVGNAGTVDVGAIDPLGALADIAEREGLWFHVDGAFGAMAALSQSLAPRLIGIERAGSIAFDFHKWLHVPYDAACLLVRDENLHRQTFASEGPYITRMDRGLAAGAPWFADFGPDLSRSFRALKVWFTIKHFGTQRLAAAIEMNCRQATLLSERIQAGDHFELAAPVSLNVVCFRRRGTDSVQADALNDALAIAVQESGQAVISSTTIAGHRVLRACFTNHRTRDEDIDILYQALMQASAGLFKG